jgi:transposase-like protein
MGLTPLRRPAISAGGDPVADVWRLRALARTNKYLNNLIEQDHRAITRLQTSSDYKLLMYVDMRQGQFGSFASLNKGKGGISR